MAVSRPTPSRVINTVLIQIRVTIKFPERIPSITPSWAEQGIASARSIVAITLSLFVSRVLVTIVAMVPQPKPKVIGITALPLNPIFLKTLSISNAIRGR